MNDIKILGIGNALVDIIALLDDDQIIKRLNLPKGSMTLVNGDLSAKIQQEITAQKTKIVTGGSVANAINGIANLGVSCGFLGTIGRDELGNLFRNDLQNHAIDHLLKYSDQPTGRAVCLVSPDGERTMATYLGAAVEMGQDDITEDKLSNFQLFFIEGYLVFNHALIMAAASQAKSVGMTIALDLASYNVVEANRAILDELVDNYVDIIFANEEEAKAFTGMEPEAALENLAGRCDIAVVKVGGEGAFVQQGQQKYHIPAFGSEVVDTTGAGDFFAAGFLAGLAKGYDLEKCGKLGSLLAGRVIRTAGAKLDAEDWVEIKNLEKTL
jgi:sugar/nucleoside kinase (ribokinase family)